MSSVSSANESQGFDEEGGAVLITSPLLSHDHALNDAPPPAPPPPPPLPTADPVERKRKVRSFYWKPIPEDRVKQQDGPNLWSLSWCRGENPFHIDIRAIEELFGQHQDTPPFSETAGKIRPGRASVKDLRQQITILDSKRSLNISIYLKHFKKSSVCLLEDVLHGNTGIFSVECLRELLKLLPEEDEVKRLQMFSGNPTDLAPPDAFMHQLIHLPRYEVRLEALLIKEELFPSLAAMKHHIAIIRTAVKELLSCQELHSVLHLVLQAGNIMNAGGSAGNAVGFKLSSLLSLADTKANKPGINLLHFVAQEAQKKDLLMFPEKLLHVQQAARVCVDSIHVEFHALTRRVDRLQQNVQSDAELQTQLQSFLTSAAEALQGLSISMEELQREGDALINFFCEDKDTFKLDECLGIFQNFCNKFKKAVQENVKREMWEESRRKRLKESEDKRHSWAGHEGVGGALGLRSSSEADVEAALQKDILQSPLLRFGSTRRPRQQKSVTSDPSGTDTHVLPPIHSLSIADPVSRYSSETGEPVHDDPKMSCSAPLGNLSECDSIPEDRSSRAEPVAQKNTLSTQESTNNDLQMPEVTPDVTFDPSQVEPNDDHREPTSTTRDDLQLSCQSLNESLNTSAGVTPSVQKSSKRPATSKHKPPASAKSSSSSIKPAPSSSSSSSPKCTAASENASLRKVVPLRQPRNQDRPIQNVLRNAKSTQAVRTTTGEKICRAALDCSSPRTSVHNYTITSPGFARNTVASTTRSAATPGTRPSALKPPPLTRTASLRLSQALRQQETAAGSARLPPPAGRQRKSSSAASENSFIRGSRDKSVKPVWR